MVSQAKKKLNRSVHIDFETGRLRLTKAYAERNLSDSALKYAEKIGNYYDFVWGRTSYIVAFELPNLLNIEFHEIMRYLIGHCFPYVKENNLTDSVMYPQFVANAKKSVK